MRVSDPAPAVTEAFNLSSRPSAVNKIWLDFRGSTYKNTAWNSAYNRSTITVPAFDIDGNPANFSTAELQV
jgi:hypothetical protein